MHTIPILLAALALNGQNAVAGPDPYAEVNAMRIAFTHVRSVIATERSTPAKPSSLNTLLRTAFTSRCPARRSCSPVTLSMRSNPGGLGNDRPTAPSIKCC